MILQCTFKDIVIHKPAKDTVKHSTSTLWIKFQGVRRLRSAVKQLDFFGCKPETTSMPLPCNHASHKADNILLATTENLALTYRRQPAISSR